MHFKMHTGHIIVQCLNTQEEKKRHKALGKPVTNQLAKQFEIIIT